jgi:portal protein
VSTLPTSWDTASRLNPLFHYESKTEVQPMTIARLSHEPPMAEPDDLDIEIHAEAIEHFEQCHSNESRWRIKARFQLDFLNGEHWTDAMKQERQGLPCLTFDRINPSIKQVVNDTKQSPLQPKVSPVGKGGDTYTAEVIEGLIRNIENDSNAIPSYNRAYEHCCQIGRGWIGVSKEYETEDPDSPEAFQKKLVIRGFPNPFSVYPDPSADAPDLSDMRFAFVTEDLTREVYRELFPESRVVLSSQLEGTGDKPQNRWYPNGNIRIAEYWRVWVKVERIALLEGGRVVPIDHPAITQDGAVPRAVRDIHQRKVKCYVINGEEILDRWDWEGSSIPLVPVLGEEYILDDRRQYRGMIESAMDSNLMFDYLASKIAQGAALAPISQWMAAAGQIEGYEYIWNDSNRKAYTVLPWKPISIGGQPVPPPIRITPDVNMGGLVQTLSVFDNTTKAALATYDPSLGVPEPGQSGRAIIARQREGDNAHYNYRDSLSTALRRVMKIILEEMPHVYNEAQIITINDPDGSTRTIPVNQANLIEGTDRIYRLGKDHGVGRYDVVIGSGQNYATQRQFAFESFMQMLQAAPAIMAPCAGIALKNADIPGADKMADIINARAGIPPDTSAVPMAAQQMIQQLQQQLQLQGALLAKAQSEIERDRLKYASAENIVGMQEETKRALGLLKAGSEQAIAQLQEEMAMTRARMEQLMSNPETANPEQPQAPPPGPLLPPAAGAPVGAPPAGGLPPPPPGAPIAPPAPPPQ